QEIYKDRQKFSEQVFKVASSDLVNMGISVVSYTLKDIHDDQVAPGGTHEGEHKGTRWAQGTPGSPPMQPHSAWVPPPDGWVLPKHLYPADPGVPPKHLGSPLRPRSPGMLRCPPETPESRPGAWVARTKQQIEEQRAQVLVVERAQQAQLQEHEIGRRERELEATVRKPAEAERYRLERLAEAQR
ncbi:FLOT1 protein, partial [Spizaetus tyrannus]|nr:FLOT1 protein [Spizaetus tyrannus]